MHKTAMLNFIGNGLHNMKKKRVPKGTYTINGRAFKLSRPVPAVKFNFTKFVNANKDLFNQYKSIVDKAIEEPLPEGMESLKIFRKVQIEKALYDLMNLLTESGKLEDLLAIGLLPKDETETTKDVEEIADWLKNYVDDTTEARIFIDFFRFVWLESGSLFPAIS